MSGVVFCEKCSNIYDIGEGSKGEELFICKSCGFSKQIEPGKIILSRGEEINDTDVDINKKRNCHTLMHTSNYVCPNKNCITHKDASKKDMIMEYTKRDSYKRRMICLACGTKWM